MPKSTVPPQLAENIDVFDFALDEEEMTALNALDVGPEARIFTFSSFPGYGNAISGYCRLVGVFRSIFINFQDREASRVPV